MKPVHRQATRTLPDDFMTVAPTMAIKDLQRHYATNHRTIKRWFRQSGAQHCNPHKHTQEVPADFADNAKVLTITQLRKHYGGGHKKIERWLNLLGIEPLRAVHPGPKKRADTPQRHRPATHNINRMGTSYIGIVDRGIRTRSIHDEAADVLRRERWVVYRSTDKGRADHKGEFWRVGNTVLTPDELLQRAERYRSAAA